MAREFIVPGQMISGSGALDMAQFVSWKKHFRLNILYLRIILDEITKRLET